jgi:hypothetical protein
LRRKDDIPGVANVDADKNGNNVTDGEENE